MVWRRLRTTSPARGDLRSDGCHGRETVPQRSRRPLRRLEGTSAKEKLYDVAFMRLQPIQTRGRHRSEIQAVNVNGVEKLPPEGGFVGNRGANQRGTDAGDHLLFGALHNGNKREHVLAVRRRRFA